MRNEARQTSKLPDVEWDHWLRAPYSNGFGLSLDDLVRDGPSGSTIRPQYHAYAMALISSTQVLWRPFD